MSVLTSDWPLDDERELLADACRRNFWSFVCFGFGVKENPDGFWLDEKVHKPLCDWLEGIAAEWFAMRRTKDQRRFYILIDAARGSGKTVIVTKAFTAWLHLQDPNLSTVVDSVTKSKAEEFVEVLKKLYEGKDPCALFCWLYGKWEGVDPWTKSRFTHRARGISRSEASVETSAVEVGITGDHPDHLVIDDPITREKLRETGGWVQLANTHVGSLFPALKNNSLCILCATPYIDGDVVTNAIRLDGVKEVIGEGLPPEYRRYVSPSGKWHMYFMPAATEDGRPLMPKVWPKAELEEYNRKYPADYAAQVCLRPGAGDQVPLTMEQIQDRLVERKVIPRNLTFTIHCDTAFKDPKKMGMGDESVLQVWGHAPESGDVYFMEGYGSNKWRSEDFTDKLIEIVQRYKRGGKTIRGITDEKQIGGKEGTWKILLQSAFSNAGMWMPPYHEVERRGTKKVTRIAEAAGYWVDGHVYLCRDAPGLPNLMWQQSRIGISDHDDWADAAADVFNPVVYRPYRPIGADADPPTPQRPWDDYLKTGRLNTDSMRAIYDRQEELEWTRGPIR